MLTHSVVVLAVKRPELPAPTTVSSSAVRVPLRSVTPAEAHVAAARNAAPDNTRRRARLGAAALRRTVCSEIEGGVRNTVECTAGVIAVVESVALVGDVL